MKPNGFTMVEIVLTAGLVSVLILGGARLFPVLSKYMQNNRVRQIGNLETRMCLETIERTLAIGRASTLAVATPATTPTVQNSSATFQGTDGSWYTIAWSNQPMNTVRFQRTAPDGTQLERVLATHVTGLGFEVNGNDPGIISFVLRFTIPLDASGNPDSFTNTLLPKRTIRMSSF